MSNLQDIVVDSISAAFNRGEDYAAEKCSIDQVDIIANRTIEELRELINTLLGESIRDTNNSDEAIALFRERVKKL